MSDKSFGDYSNRNIVKNPLLSTAVIGLSIEDLTHNAVLLPAVPSQELIIRQDKKTEDQLQTLRESDVTTNFQSGDANANRFQHNTFPNLNLENQNRMHPNTPNLVNISTTSKALQKSEDDFDVNEYFARLQGTRYVSAPLNSCIKEDQNANMQLEENLEEINLNEPDKSVDDTQHSITSDIAQNFSQLPTVLPQVASVVFSSFSNMLSMKSREQTPDDGKDLSTSYEATVPLSVPEVPAKDIAPPPLKEPPVSGISNYRITTKKKVYAQIPGLSYGEKQNTPAHIQPSLQPPTSFFIPESSAKEAVNLFNKDSTTNLDTETSVKYRPDEIKPDIITPKSQVFDNNESKTQNVEANITNQSQIHVTHKSITSQMPYTSATQTQTVIPPPPMFSSLPPRSQTSVEKTILPPSVARRIAANHPVIKPKIPTAMPISDNMLLPDFSANIPPNIDTGKQPSHSMKNENPNLNTAHEGVPKTNADLTSLPQVFSSFGPVDVFESSKLSYSTPITTESISIGYPPQSTNLPNLPNQSLMHPSTETFNMSAETTLMSKLHELSTRSDANFVERINQEATSVLPPTYKDNQTSQMVNIPQPEVPSQFKDHPPNEPKKAIVKPPKLTGNLNYRMSKKKPQYYSGPIEGVGNISNSMKPVINPVAPTNFQGSLFTPSQDIQTSTQTVGTDYSSQTNMAAPFDITKPAPFDITTPAPFDITMSKNVINTSYAQTQQQPLEFNTVFDLSRPTTESYETPQPENRGFGIIGSLKSKLSSIDINKIQNTVTTFFDPAYNDIKATQSSNPDNFSQQQNIASGNYFQNDSNLEIFVPTAEPNIQANIYGTKNIYSPGTNRENQYYPTSNYQYFNDQYQYQNYSTLDDTNYKSYQTQYPYMNIENSVQGTDHVELVQEEVIKSIVDSTVKIVQDSPIPPSLPSSSSDQKKENNKVIQSKLPLESFFGQQPNPSKEYIGVVHDNDKTEDDEISEKSEQKITRTVETMQSVTQQTSSEPLFTDFLGGTSTCNLSGFSANENTSICNYKGNTEHDKSNREGNEKQIGDQIPPPYSALTPRIETSVKNTEKSQKIDSNQHLNSFFDKTTDFSASFSPFTNFVIKDSFTSNIENEDKKLGVNIFKATEDTEIYGPAPIGYSTEIVPDEFVENQVSELNICETCREVNKTELEEKAIEDVTVKMIENITAPIQLSNPVEAPLPEESMTMIDPANITNQFAENPEISQIVEDNGVDILSAVELLADNNVSLTYGWSTNNYASNVHVDQNYNSQPDPNAIGFFQNKSHFENIPTNASDEIKAEFKNTYDDVPILPRQMSIPTAPIEEDTKSDEGGLDVQSIEQDAKKDFPIFEEFVIEPSETDDDKIEYKERTRSSEDPTQEADTFTNRVERYKQMESAIDSMDDVFEMEKDINKALEFSTSPAITLASYFDTGNYAVETHYKNSITVASNVSSLTPDSNSMRVPPGFEEEYQRRLSEVSAQDIPQPYIPDTSTQTRTTTTVSFSQHFQPSTPTTESNIENMIKELVLEDSPKEKTNLKDEIHNQRQFLKTNETQNQEPLTDPISFFCLSTENTEQDSVPDAYSDFNRLSSYFTTPEKPDQTKSFFELSQSQNHYRKDTPKEHSRKNESNIPQNYLANMDLVRDLASYKNFTPSETVTTVGYVTVEYDNKIDDRLGKPEIPHKIADASENINNKPFNNTNDIEIDNNDNLLDDPQCIILNCQTCCSKYNCEIYVGRVNTNKFKVRKFMDDNSNREGDSNMTSKKEGAKKYNFTVNIADLASHEERNEESSVLVEERSATEYTPVKHHWFYRVECDGSSIWRGFSVADSTALENAFNSPDLDEKTVVATDGGRYDVHVIGRLRTAVYWNDKPNNVMRCSWFYKGTTDARYVPYTEAVAEQLEEEYCHGIRTGEWHRRLLLPNNESVVMHGPAVMVHFMQNNAADTFTSTQLFSFGKRVYRNPPRLRVSEDQPDKIDHLILIVHGAGEYRHEKEKNQSMRPRVVRRGCDESEIENTEPSRIDHLLFLCHGVGSVCDMRMRAVEAVVNDFRATSLQLIQSHYKNSYETGLVGRVEVLPISWHWSLHSGETGVDKRLAAVTLESIPWLRNFTNDTILDVLFYTSPVFCQHIIETVCKEMNRIYKLFRARNPDFQGGVSLGGHSLGSVILYDILCHQTPQEGESEVTGFANKTYVTDEAGPGQPLVRYPSLAFKPHALYALGSPIAIFECIRGVETLGQEFRLPTCRHFFNIFHPYDPIAYRIEPMINPILRDVKPFLIPHHKGRKRMHLELRDTMARFGADLKQRLLESIKSTWSSMWKTTSPTTDQQLEKVVEEEIEKEQMAEEAKEELKTEIQTGPEMLGLLNNGRRVDYVLQEAPFEMINEYLFAMSSHVCYWESEDTMLLILREIYESLGIAADSSVPQQNLTVQRTRTLSADSTTVSPFPDTPSTSRNLS